MHNQEAQNILFVINPGAGKQSINWPDEIDVFFNGSVHVITKVFLTPGCNTDTIKQQIAVTAPQKVIAVGGDGTVKLVAECLLHTGIRMGILPSGSANGLAKELGIPTAVRDALQLVLAAGALTIHLLEINGQLCVHLSDIGFNASVIKLFETEGRRGMGGYIKAAWKVLWKHARMEVTIKIDDRVIKRQAAMLVMANATRYGSGAVINPAGRLNDNLFEVVIIKQVSFSEIFKMMVSHRAYDENKTELYQAHSVHIQSRKKAHFQVDGQYLGKTNNVHAILLEAALNIINK